MYDKSTNGANAEMEGADVTCTSDFEVQYSMWWERREKEEISVGEVCVCMGVQGEG